MADENAVAETAASKKAKAEIENVTMEDGRTVGFIGKRKMLKDILIEGTDVKVRFDFRNGLTRTFEIPPAQLLHAAGHGYGQKLGDQVAGMKNDDGSAVDEDDLCLEIETLHERIAKEGWNAVREGGGGQGGTSVLLRALVELTGKTVPEVKEFLKGLTQGDKIGLRNDPEVKPIVEKIEAEKAAKATAKVDTTALKSKLTSFVSANPA